MPVAPADAAGLAAATALIEQWLERQRVENPVLVTAERDPDPALRRWYVRLRGEQRDFVAIWFTLGAYTLGYETYVMPAPEEPPAPLWDFLLRRNPALYGMAFAIGPEDAVYLIGRLPLAALDEDELDRILGSAYAYVEQWFRPAMRLGYGARFRG